MKKKINRVLISVSDKSNLNILMKTLIKYNVEVISSGGTFNAIKELGYECKDVSNFTRFKEMLDGRVKTLHPKIHAGILNDRSNKKHKREMKKNKFYNIDLIIVNFYPFQNMANSNRSFNKIIENIDIGGPTMVRAAAKNFKDVLIISDAKDYFNLKKELDKNNGCSSLEFRKRMASKAFGLTAYYDSIISNWFYNKLDINFPDTKTIYGKKIQKLRYGENPHQNASIYLSKDNFNFKKIRGKELSYNNYNDIFAGLDILSSLKQKGSVIIKHANPSGVAINKIPIKSFIGALKSDPISAYGGLVFCNFKINRKISKEISKTFFEIILAKGFDKEAIKVLSRRKKQILIDISKYKSKNNQQIRNLGDSFLIQDKDNKIFDKNKLKMVTKLKPTKNELQEIEFAYNICKFVKSNSIVITKNLSTIGIGAGQQSRVDSCRIAIRKAKRFQLSKLSGSVAASDAFFPFPDGIKVLIKAGIKIIVQPGGSIRDKESIDIANKSGVKMIFTGYRHFYH